MRVLYELVNLKRTVVFQSIPQNKIWIFRSDGNCRMERNVKDVSELDSRETFHLFDAKAGRSEEPIESYASLIEFSSTNLSSYKQTDRRINVLKVLYPSTSYEEFEKYADKFNVLPEQRKIIIDIIGSGKIRSLRKTISYLNGQINRAVAQFGFNKLLTYACSDNTTENLMENPAILLDAFVSKENENCTDLCVKYDFEQAIWNFASEGIRRRIITTFSLKPNEVLSQLYMSMNRAKFIQILGVFFLKSLRYVYYTIIKNNHIIRCSSRQYF